MRDASRFVARQSLTTQRYPSAAAQSSTVVPSALPTPAPRASSSTAAKPRRPASSGRASPRVQSRLRHRAADGGADDAPVDDCDEGGERRVVEVLLPFGPRLLERRRRQGGEHGSAHLVCRKDELELGQGVDVVADGPPDLDARKAHGERCTRCLPDRVDVLLSEAEPEPGVDERGVARGDDGVVRRATLVDPAGCREGIEVARRLGLGDGVAGRLDPDVRPPDRVLSRGADARSPRWRRRGSRPRPEAPSVASSSIAARATSGRSYAAGRPGSTSGVPRGGARAGPRPRRGSSGPNGWSSRRATE